MPKFKKEYLRVLAAVSSLGIEMAVSIIVGYFIGKYLDKLFNTGTILTIVFILFGIGAGFKRLLSLSKSYQQDLDDNKLNDIYEEDEDKKDTQ